MMRTELDHAFSSLDKWIAEYGWAGYDPYDVRGQDWYVRLLGRQNWFFKKLRGVFALVENELPPATLRRILAVPKAINAKGMGLLASAWLDRWQATGDDTFKGKAEDVLRWLAENPSEGYPGTSWGYPFHWQSRVFLPRGTPSVVVTATVGDAWLHHYEATRDDASMAVLEGIATFLTAGLNRPVDDRDLLCFSYTPMDHFKVHNANLFGAAFLAQFGKITHNADLTNLALRSVRYTLSEQNADGSFYYWGSEPPTIIDHYHTGFVLRHLDTVRRSTGAEFIAPPLQRGFAFYTERMFSKDGVPKFTPDSLYPVDIHSCAEALLCVAQLGPALGSMSLLQSTFDFVQDRMLTIEGWYVAEIRSRRGREHAVKIPYLRWGQAWMLLALARTALAVGDAAPAEGSES